MPDRDSSRIEAISFVKRRQTIDSKFGPLASKKKSKTEEKIRLNNGVRNFSFSVIQSRKFPLQT